MRDTNTSATAWLGGTSAGDIGLAARRGPIVEDRARGVRDPVRVLLIRGHPESAGVAMLRHVLAEMSDPPEIDEEHSLARALVRLDFGPTPDLVLFEPHVEDGNGLEALGVLASRHPAPLRVLLLRGDLKHLADTVLSRGADDFLLPDETDSRTLARILRYARRRRMAEADLREAATRYRTLFERAPDGIFVADGDGILQDVNPRLAELFGYGPDELIGKRVEILVPEASEPAHAVYRLEDGETPVARPMGLERHLMGRRKDGSTFPAEVGLAPLPFPGRRLVVASVRDLSAQEERRRLADIVDASDDAILSVALDGTIESWNRGAARFFGRTREEVSGHPLSSILAPEVIEELPDILRRVRAGEHVHSVEDFHVTEGGHRMHLALAFSPLTDRSGRITGAAVIGRDITRRKLLEADLEELAYKDPLTRVANRRFLRERMEYALSLARREQSRVGLVYLDIDGFKEINDRFGHSAGDTILAEVARRLQQEARESDLVARFGGDEFVILLSKVDDEDGVIEATRRFEAALADPVLLAAGHEVSVRAQFGVALYPDHGRQADQLLAVADRVMYSRKKAQWIGRTTPGVAEAVGGPRPPSPRRGIEDAVAEGQLRLYGQRITRAADGELAGVEVFVRWKHPEDGLLAAGEFLPAARDLGLMPRIDLWVIEQLLTATRTSALRGLGAWFAVNVSDQTVGDPEAVSSLAAVIEDLGPPPAGLRIELREHPSLLGPRVRAGVERLRGLGVSVVLDNYGLGHNSLARLRERPADAFKLDGSLVRQLGRDRGVERIIHAAVDFGRAVGMQVGVQGVERADEADRLRAHGCQLLQGFHFGRPVPLGDSFLQPFGG